MIYVPKHFKTYELVDKVTYNKFGDMSIQFMHEDILRAIDELRELIGEPLTINNWVAGGQYNWSGLRTLDCKEGANYSAHRFGMAVDVKADTKTSEEVRAFILAKKGLGLLKPITRMEADTPTWTHIDCMPTNSDKLIVFKDK